MQVAAICGSERNNGNTALLPGRIQCVRTMASLGRRLTWLMKKPAA